MRYSQDKKTIAIPIFENKTIRRGHEFELTHFVQQKVLAQTPLMIISRPEQADLVLSGEITDYTKPALIEGRRDQVILSQVAITLKLVLMDQKSGKILYEGQQTATAELVGIRNESEESALAEVYEKLARRVVTLLETRSE